MLHESQTPKTVQSMPRDDAWKACLDPKSPFQPVVVGHYDIGLALSNESAFVTYIDCNDFEWVNYRRVESDADRPFPSRKARRKRGEQAAELREQMKDKSLPNRLLFSIRRFTKGSFTDENFIAGLYDGDPLEYYEDSISLQGKFPDDFWFVARGEFIENLRLRHWENGAWSNPDIDNIRLSDSRTEQQAPAAILPWGKDSSLVVFEPEAFSGLSGLTTFATLGNGRQPQLRIHSESHPHYEFATLLPSTLYVATAWNAEHFGELFVYIDTKDRPPKRYQPLGAERVSNLIGIYPRSMNDVFVLLETNESILLHFQGHSWQRQPLPAKGRCTEAYLDDNGVLWVALVEDVGGKQALWYWDGHWHLAFSSEETVSMMSFEAASRYIRVGNRVYHSSPAPDQWMELPLFANSSDETNCKIAWLRSQGDEIWAKVILGGQEVLLRQGGAKTIDVCVKNGDGEQGT